MPNQNILNEKKQKVAEITEMLKNATSGVLVNYSGISVEDDTKLRKELREAGVKYTVEKNTLLRFAMQNAGLDGLTRPLWRYRHCRFVRRNRRRPYPWQIRRGTRPF